MKFYNVLVSFMLIAILSAISTESIKNVRIVQNKNVQIENDLCELKFISVSFRNTCNGKGFSSLNEWQKVCKDLFNLDYIGWSKVDSFMELSKENNSSVLYGKWISKNNSGEVYCKTK